MPEQIAGTRTSHGVKIRRIVAGALVASALVYLGLRLFEHYRTFHSSFSWSATPADYRLAFENLSIPVGSRGRLSAWFLPAPVPAPNSTRVVLICHGTGANISGCLGVAKLFRDEGLNMLLFDDRGFGRSSAWAGEERTYEDAQAAYGWLRGKGFAPENIVAYGESLGGGPATELAAREKVGGLILVSTFTGAMDLGVEISLPVRPSVARAGCAASNSTEKANAHRRLRVRHGIDIPGLGQFSHQR